MGYGLGIDLGTTFSAAAISTEDRVEVFALGGRTATIPSIVAVREHGEVLVGEAAERRALSEPARAAREFKRRLGDPTPIFLGGVPYGAESLTAHLLRAIVELVVERQGGPPDRIAITHPATYRDYKLDQLRLAVGQADVGLVTFVSEPEAAAIYYASQDRVEDGAVVAVYDFGGGTFDATVVRRTGGGFQVVGTPEGMERIGGVDFDDALLAHVDEALGGALSARDIEDPANRSALARLRDECRQAKEALSSDTDASIPVSLPGLNTEVRVTRAGFESLIRPRVTETVEALQRAVRSAGVGMQDVARVLLVGGTSNIPLVRQLVREATGRPVALDAHPKHSVSLGAAQLVRPAHAAAPVAAAPVAPTQVASVPPGAGPGAAAPAPPTPVVTALAPQPSSRSKRRTLVPLILLAVLILLGGVAFLLTRGGDGNDGVDAAGPESTTKATTRPAGNGPTNAAAPNRSRPATGGIASFGDMEVKPGTAKLQGPSLLLPVTVSNKFKAKDLSLSGLEYQLMFGDGTSITGTDQRDTLVLKAGTSGDLGLLFDVGEGASLDGAAVTIGAPGKEPLSLPLDGGDTPSTPPRALAAKGTASFDNGSATMTFSLRSAQLSLDREIEVDSVNERVADRRAPQGSAFLSLSLRLTASACECPGGVNWSSSLVHLVVDGTSVETWTLVSGVVASGGSVELPAGFVVPADAKKVVLVVGPSAVAEGRSQLTIDLSS